MLLLLYQNHLFQVLLTVFVDISNKFLDAPFVVEGAFLFLAFPQVDKVDLQTFCEESRFPQALFQNITPWPGPLPSAPSGISL